MLSYSVVFMKKVNLLLMFSWETCEFFKKVVLNNTSEQLLLYWLFNQIQIKIKSISIQSGFIIFKLIC